MKKLIVDTNAIYDFSTGLLSYDSLVTDGYNIYATPINLFEILSKLSDKNYQERKNAISIIKNHNVPIAKTTESILDEYWSVNDFDLNPREYPWNIWIDAVLCSNSLNEAEEKIRSFPEYFNTSIILLNDWRLNTWDTFKTDIENIIKVKHPEYVQLSNYKYLKDSNNQSFLAYINNFLFKVTILNTTLQRVLRSTNYTFAKYIDKVYYVSSKIESYINIFYEYILECALKKGPQKNDWGDLDLFLYLDGNTNTFIGTSENRWIELSKKASISNVIDLKVYRQDK